MRAVHYNQRASGARRRNNRALFSLDLIVKFERTRDCGTPFAFRKAII